MSQEDTIKGFASDSGHWYKRDGTPAYTIIGKNGKERPTTLRDARKYSLIPSTTTIIKVAASPGLERWKLQSLLLAALTLPKHENEDLDAYSERVIKDSQEQGKRAMELGTSIHGSLELAYQNKDFPIEHTDYVDSVQEAVFQTFGHQIWSPERSFASDLGFGGKIDLSSDSVVIDFKTKAFKATDKIAGYDEHKMQLASYAEGLKLPKNYRAANVFVSTTEPGLVRIVEWSQDDLRQGLAMFLNLLSFWQVKNRHV